jgi:hypothetical protein
MGYEFYVPEVTIGRAKGGRVEVELKIENHGVAPFYYDWKAEYGLLAQGNPVKTLAGSGTLTCLLPGHPPRVWEDTLDVTGVGPGTYLLAVRVPNPLKAGPPLRFANLDQDAAAAGWLSLGEVELQAD